MSDAPPPPGWSLSVRDADAGAAVVVLEAAGVSMVLAPDQARRLSLALEQAAEGAQIRIEACDELVNEATAKTLDDLARPLGRRPRKRP